MEKKFKARSISMADEDWELLEAVSEAAGYSKSAYLRSLLHMRRPSPLPTPEWKACYRELAAIGNNINQIAKISHVTGEIDKQELDECYDAILKMRDVLQSYVQPQPTVGGM